MGHVVLHVDDQQTCSRHPFSIVAPVLIPVPVTIFVVVSSS